MRKLIPFVLTLAFFAFLMQRVLQSHAQSDVYPEYSTLRSDPHGGKVLYESLRTFRGGGVDRNYEPLESLEPRRALYVLMGASPVALRETKEWEQLLHAGGTVLIGLKPASSKAGSRTEKLGFLHVRTSSGASRLLLKGDEWRCLDGDRDECVLADRKLGKGVVWLLADASPLRNLDLHQSRDTALVARLFGGSLPIVFDESHLGVENQSGVGVLLRKHRLFGAIGMLLLLALLFVWRNSASLLPERSPLPPELMPQPAASLRTLLEQNVPPARLLDTLAAEWKHSRPLLPEWQKGREGELESALELAKGKKDLRQGYEQLQAAVRLRKDSI
jgi:hypothetical protein